MDMIKATLPKSINPMSLCPSWCPNLTVAEDFSTRHRRPRMALHQEYSCLTILFHIFLVFTLHSSSHHSTLTALPRTLATIRTTLTPFFADKTTTQRRNASLETPSTSSATLLVTSRRRACPRQITSAKLIASSSINLSCDRYLVDTASAVVLAGNPAAGRSLLVVGSYVVQR